MYFYEILRDCKETVLTEEFLKLCSDSADLAYVKEQFQKFLKTIKNIQPEISDEWTLSMIEVESTDSETYYDVRAKRIHDFIIYGIEVTPWKELLGWLVDSETLISYSKEVFTAHVLRDLTCFGWDEETIQERSSIDFIPF